MLLLINAFQAFDEFLNTLGSIGQYPPYARPPLIHLYLISLGGSQQDLGLGSAVLNEQNGSRTVVGWDGVVYLENLTAQNSLQVIMPDGQQCRAQFALPPVTDQVPLIDPVVCQ